MSVALQESPTEYQTSPSFGPLTPSQAGQLSGIQRRRQAERCATIDRISLELLPAVERLVSTPQVPNPSYTQEIEKIQSQIARIDSLIDQEETAKGMQCLCAAKEKLCNIWTHLAGIPKPMAGREPRQSQRRVSLTPIDIDLPQVPKLPAEPTPSIPELSRDVTP